MSNVGKPSTIAVHPARAEIERALDAGEPYRSISSKYGVSRSALSRFALSRAPLVRVLNEEPNVTDVVPRLLEAADDARDLRRHTRSSGNPPARARAIKVEADILTTLADRLGIDELAIEDFYLQTNSLVRALMQQAKTDPDATRSLIRTLRAGYPALIDLADALDNKLGA